jgi:glucose-1-phosphate thymidylyltransferase
MPKGMREIGIILAGGHATRLYPATNVLSKQLLPVYDKPTIYYPICTLLELGITEMIVISNPEHIESYKNLLSDDIGVKFTFVVQDKPKGIADALLVCEEHIRQRKVYLILGDNFFHGLRLNWILGSVEYPHKAVFVLSEVKDPTRYGVAIINKNGTLTSIQEKPNKTKHKYAVTGFYGYDETVLDKLKLLQPSKRGELEITDLNNLYLNSGDGYVGLTRHEGPWFDMGTPDSLLEAASYVQAYQNRTGKLIGSIHQTAYDRHFISKKKFVTFIDKYSKSDYGKSLRV